MIYKIWFSVIIFACLSSAEDSNHHFSPSFSLCSLDTKYQAKISDGALSQCFYPECYNTVRWAAIETLQEGLCTSHSNVVRRRRITTETPTHCILTCLKALTLSILTWKSCNILPVNLNTSSPNIIDSHKGWKWCAFINSSLQTNQCQVGRETRN